MRRHSTFGLVQFRFTKLSTLIATSVLILSSTVQAATPTAPASNGISLRDVLSAGLKRSPRIKKSEAALASAQARKRGAIGSLFPTVKLRGTYTEEDSEFYRAYVEAIQPIYSSGVFSGLSLRNYEEDIATLQNEQEIRLYIRDLAVTYFNVAEQTRLLSAAEQNIAILRRHADVISRYEKIGRARRTDKLQTQVNLSTALVDVSQLKSQLVGYKEQLRELLATDEVPDIDQTEPANQTASAANLPAPGAAIQTAISGHPSIRIAELNVEKVESEKGVALNNDLPTLTVGGQWGYKKSTYTDLFKAGSDYNAVTVNLIIPIFSGLTSLATRRDYEERKVSATRDLELAKFALEANIRTQLEDLSTYRERLPLAKQTVQDAEEALVLANRDYARSLISSLDVTNIQRTRYDADRLWVHTQYDYARALIQFQELHGDDLKKLYAK